MCFGRWQSAVSKGGLNDAAKAASEDTTGSPPLFLWCRGQHPKPSACKALQAGSKRALGAESSTSAAFSSERSWRRRRQGGHRQMFNEKLASQFQGCLMVKDQ